MLALKQSVSDPPPGKGISPITRDVECPLSTHCGHSELGTREIDELSRTIVEGGSINSDERYDAS